MSKEHDKFKAEQEIKKAAELKAKLDLVETCDKPKWGRPPKKIGTMVCDTGVRVGYGTSNATFVLRLENDGTFIAEHGDFWYKSKSRDALKAKMDQVAKVTLDLKWERYLAVEYKAEVANSETWRGGRGELDIDDQRKKDTVVYGINLQWSVVEYAGPIQLPDLGERYMKRDVDEDGKPESAQESVPNLPDGLVLYTEEREATLLRLRAALASVDAKMVELFRGAPDRVAEQLDAVHTSTSSGVMLLQAPDMKPKKIKR